MDMYMYMAGENERALQQRCVRGEDMVVVVGGTPLVRMREAFEFKMVKAICFA